MELKPFELVKTMELIVADIRSVSLTFMPGRSKQVTKMLIEYDRGGEEWKNQKYPLLAMKMPVTETYGSGKIVVRFESIIIATLSNDLGDVIDRYNDGGTYRSILFPAYTGFLQACARSIFVDGQDPTMFKHSKLDFPGVAPKDSGITDYIDSLEIKNLELTFNQIKNC